MNNSNHTPGPWTFKKIPLWTPDKPTTDGIPHFECCSDGGSEWLKTAKANSRLVASAPDLLETLEKLGAAAARIVEDDNKPTLVHMCELNRCRAAAVIVIDQAKGGAS